MVFISKISLLIVVVCFVCSVAQAEEFSVVRGGWKVAVGEQQIPQGGYAVGIERSLTSDLSLIGDIGVRPDRSVESRVEADLISNTGVAIRIDERTRLYTNIGYRRSSADDAGVVYGAGLRVSF